MSDFGEFTLMYKRSDSADLVRDSFRDVFDKYQFLSNNLEVFDLEIPAPSIYTVPIDPAVTVLFAMYVLRDTYPATVNVAFTSVGGGSNRIEVKGLENSNLSKIEDETGSFMVFPQIQAGTGISLSNTSTDPTRSIKNSTFYLVTT